MKNQEGHWGYCWCRWVERTAQCEDNIRFSLSRSLCDQVSRRMRNREGHGCTAELDWGKRTVECEGNNLYYYSFVHIWYYLVCVLCHMCTYVAPGMISWPTKLTVWFELRTASPAGHYVLYIHMSRSFSPTWINRNFTTFMVQEGGCSPGNNQPFSRLPDWSISYSSAPINNTPPTYIHTPSGFMSMTNVPKYTSYTYMTCYLTNGSKNHGVLMGLLRVVMYHESSRSSNFKGVWKYHAIYYCIQRIYRNISE